MTDRIDAARRVARAIRGDVDPADVASLLADDAALRTVRGSVSGRTQLLAELARPETIATYASVTWSDPVVVDDGVVKVAGHSPPGARIAHTNLYCVFDADDRITELKVQIVGAAPPAPTPLVLTDEMKAHIDSAYANGTPMLVAYIDADGAPRMTLRGTAQAYGDQAIALWSRTADGGIVRGVVRNPNVSAFYRDAKAGVTLNLVGRGRVEHDPEARRQIFDKSPEIEQLMDPMREGAAIVVDLDRIEGTVSTGRVVMRRDA